MSTQKRSLERMRGYRTCIIVATIARAGGVVSDEHLRTRIGKYATNVLYGVVQVGFIRATDDDESHWELTGAGCELAEQLLGEPVSSRHDWQRATGLDDLEIAPAEPLFDDDATAATE